MDPTGFSIFHSLALCLRSWGSHGSISKNKRNDKENNKNKKKNFGDCSRHTFNTSKAKQTSHYSND